MARSVNTSDNYLVTKPTQEPQTPYQPALRDMIMLELPLEAKVSPSGDHVAIRVRTTNWKENRYERVCHIHDLAADTTYPLNRTGNVTQMEWVEDQTLAMLREGPGKDDKRRSGSMRAWSARGGRLPSTKPAWTGSIPLPKDFVLPVVQLSYLLPEPLSIQRVVPLGEELELE